MNPTSTSLQAILSGGLQGYILVALLLFLCGLGAVLGRRSILVQFMGVELMLNAVNLTLITFSRFNVSDRPVTGQTFVVFVITVAAAEAAVALAMAVSVYRNRQTVDVDRINLLKS